MYSSALGTEDALISRCGRFTSWERATCVNRVGRWVGLRAGLNMAANKALRASGRKRPTYSQPRTSLHKKVTTLEVFTS